MYSVINKYYFKLAYKTKKCKQTLKSKHHKILETESEYIN